jgi:hypothetical protein
MEGEDLVVLEGLLAGDASGDDLAEQAAHGGECTSA